jgi:hypothetical protein
VKRLELLTAATRPTSKITFVIGKGEQIASSRFVLYSTDVVMPIASQLHLTDRLLETDESPLGSEMTGV